MKLTCAANQVQSQACNLFLIVQSLMAEDAPVRQASAKPSTRISQMLDGVPAQVSPYSYLHLKTPQIPSIHYKQTPFPKPKSSAHITVRSMRPVDWQKLPTTPAHWQATVALAVIQPPPLLIPGCITPLARLHTASAVVPVARPSAAEPP